ncbi:uncharacterized protein LOC124175576 [Neodiprion fabricii]|uniref:uncharacterized protein LOC124175576 n=1 Tax=Neodiprion fabricii TaxID=2872261 RepID=UPI001ED8F46C|nr:uncharacterized protein LOC124175576 [Neodiprion fabricii]
MENRAPTVELSATNGHNPQHSGNPPTDSGTYVVSPNIRPAILSTDCLPPSTAAPDTAKTSNSKQQHFTQDVNSVKCTSTSSNRKRGRRSNLERLESHPSPSNQITDYFPSNTPASPTDTSPPAKIIRSSAPPMITQQSPSDTQRPMSMEQFMTPIAQTTDISPSNATLSLSAVLQTLRTWRDEDKAEQLSIKNELLAEISAARTEHTDLLNKQTKRLQEENAQLKRQVQDLTARVTVLELNANTPEAEGNATHGNLAALEARLVKASINSFDKLTRKNNIIVRGLVPDTRSASEALADFIREHFKIEHAVLSANWIFRRNNTRSIKAVLRDNSVKTLIMNKKKNLKVDVFIDHDLTPSEELAANKLRHEAKKLRNEGKKIKFGHQRIYSYQSPSGMKHNFSTTPTITKIAQLASQWTRKISFNNLAGSDNTTSSNNSFTTLTFWNVRGLPNINDFTNFPGSILCISETWCTSTKVPLHINFSNWTKIVSPAIKSKTRGRGSGGLLSLIQGQAVTILNKSRDWIFFKCNTNGLTLITGSLYFKPDQKDLNSSLHNLQLLLNDILSQDHDVALIGGDFNARIGNPLHEDESMLEGSNLLSSRITCDNTTNKQGTTVLDFMSSNGFILLNGRTSSDHPGGYTFRNAIGKSRVDLIWINILGINHVKDMKIEYIITNSDHLPVTVILNSIRQENSVISPACSTPTPKLSWNPLYADTFRETLRWSSSIAQDFATTTVNTLSDILRESIVNAARSAKMFINKPGTAPLSSHKPWYDTECKIKKQEIVRYLQLCKSMDQNSSLWSLYLGKKKEYFSLLKTKAKQYQEDITNQFNHVKCPADFWKLVKLFERHSSPAHNIPLDIWHNYFTSSFPPKNTNCINLSQLHEDALDQAFTLEELINSINKSKRGKAPGVDPISNDFLKEMPENWYLFTLAFFNKIYETESIPDDWAKVVMFMLFRKGDNLDPANYRGMALINSLTKIFTKILHDRLRQWATSQNLNPEEQAGFCVGKGTTDNVFVLQAVVHMQLRFPETTAYALFIDFRKAFDKVPHGKLWTKLDKLGVSSKFIRTLKDFYDKASMYIRSGATLSNPIEVSEGVLQGDVLSPLLFILYLADINDFFKAQEVEGLYLDSVTQIVMLLFADEIVIVTHSANKLRLALKTLEDYCETNGLTINTSKTRIMACRTSGRLRKSDRNN